MALEPGTFPELDVGQEVVFSSPKDVSGSYMAWMKQNIRFVAKAMGITYEQLTGDLEKVNYSSIRAGLLEFRRLCSQIQTQTIVFQMCRPLVKFWMKQAILSGALNIPDFFKNTRNYTRVLWRPDSWDWVDPLKDIKAGVMSVRSGFKSRAQMVAELGMDVEDVDREISEDNKRADESELIFDSDPRRTSGSGLYQNTN